MQTHCDFLNPAMPAVQVLWDYMQLNQPIQEADCIVGFGCYNEDIPRQAAALYHQGLSQWVLFTGGLGRNTKQMWTESEAERFARIAMEEGVPREALLLENSSTNTGENILFTKALLEERGIQAKRLLGVHKPYMQRRIAAAFPVYWPEVEFSVTSWPQSLEEYLLCNEARGRSQEDTVNMIVGDFQRIDLYAKRGYQISQDIPQSAWDAFSLLCSQGYTKQVL